MKEYTYSNGFYRGSCLSIPNLVIFLLDISNIRRIAYIAFCGFIDPNRRSSCAI